MRYIDIEQVNTGMKVAKAILNESGGILVNKDVILKEPLITKIRDRGYAGIYIEDALSEDISMDQLISDETTQQAVGALKNLNVDNALESAEKIADEIFAMPDISLDMVSLRSKSDSTYLHSVNVAIYSVVIGIGMGLKKGILKELSASALLHDIGKIQIPTRILEKPGKLTIEEYEMIKKHSEYGYELLKDHVLLTSKIKMGVYMHHENVDGSGYPLGLREHQIYQFAKIIHIADVYDALSSERSYKKAILPGECSQYLMNQAGKMFQPEIVRIFLDCVPVYPKGRTVRLNTGEKAVVVENKQHHTLYPVIRLFDGTTIDLSEENEEELEIVEILL